MPFHSDVPLPLTVLVFGFFWAAIPLIASALGQWMGQASEKRAQGRQQAAASNYAFDQGNFDRFQAEQRGRQAGLQGQANENLNRANLQEQGALDRATLDLKRREFGLDAPQARARNAALGSILANVQDVTATHPRANIVNFQGGLRPSLLSPEARQLGAQMSRDALIQQMGGDKFEDIPKTELAGTDWSSLMSMKPPEQTPLPQAGGFDTFLNWGAGIGYGDHQSNLGGARGSDADPDALVWPVREHSAHDVAASGAH